MLDIQFKPVTVSLVCPDAQDEHLEICRLLAAAVVNPGFCRLLMEDPESALQAGYQGETFLLTRAERDLVLSIGATSLQDLARELSRALTPRPAPMTFQPAEVIESRLF